MYELHSFLRQFMKAGKQHIGAYPGDISEEAISLGVSLIEEEFRELKEAIEEKDLVKIADSIADLLYVAAWNGVAWGLPMPEIMNHVQRANLDKFRNGLLKNEQGKVIKPEGWKPPDEAIKHVLNWYRTDSGKEVIR